MYIITLAAIEYGRLAQLVEPPLDVRAVEGSSPPASTKKEVTFVYQKLLLFLSNQVFKQLKAVGSLNAVCGNDTIGSIKIYIVQLLNCL